MTVIEYQLFACLVGSGDWKPSYSPLLVTGMYCAYLPLPLIGRYGSFR